MADELQDQAEMMAHLAGKYLAALQELDARERALVHALAMRNQWRKLMETTRAALFARFGPVALPDGQELPPLPEDVKPEDYDDEDLAIIEGR